MIIFTYLHNFRLNNCIFISLYFKVNKNAFITTHWVLCVFLQCNETEVLIQNCFCVFILLIILVLSNLWTRAKVMSHRVARLGVLPEIVASFFNDDFFYFYDFKDEIWIFNVKVKHFVKTESKTKWFKGQKLFLRIIKCKVLWQGRAKNIKTKLSVWETGVFLLQGCIAF